MSKPFAFRAYRIWGQKGSGSRQAPAHELLENDNGGALAIELRAHAQAEEDTPEEEHGPDVPPAHVLVAIPPPRGLDEDRGFLVLGPISAHTMPTEERPTAADTSFLDLRS